jgi:two-component system, response regulator YesN
MLKLIIADDERIIRETISTIIDWNSHDIDLVGTCKDGLEAYDMILDKVPDLVLTDILMPGMDAMELLEKTAALAFPPHFILLSGYGEFEYAKKAMKYGVRHYLQKPCNKKQILESVLDEARECRKQIEQRHLQQSFALLKNLTPEVTSPSPAAGKNAEVPYPKMSHSSEKSKANLDPMILQILQYVEDHISSSNLTLKTIAEQYLFMNTDYVSRKFQKETGQKFSTYLTSVRIRKAKEYLASTSSDKIQNVARLVGYGNNPQYFSQLFHKQTGMTPSAYVAMTHPSDFHPTQSDELPFL